MNTKSNSNAQSVSPVAQVTQVSFTTSNSASDAIAPQDLAPTQTDAIKGGPGGANGGVWLNHNETVASDSSANVSSTASAEPLNSHPVQDLTPLQLDAIKGGPGGVGTNGGVFLNHNETTARDSDMNEAASATGVDPVDVVSAQDLAPSEQDAIKGGPGSGSSGGVWLNHNETAALDSEADPSTPAVC